jgi:hypothetical protein
LEDEIPQSPHEAADLVRGVAEASRVAGPIITQQMNYAAGVVKASDFDGSVFTSWGNHFQNNTYYLSDPSHPYFLWLDEKWTLDQWDLYSSEH